MSFCPCTKPILFFALETVSYVHQNAANDGESGAARSYKVAAILKPREISVIYQNSFVLQLKSRLLRSPGAAGYSATHAVTH